MLCPHKLLAAALLLFALAVEFPIVRRNLMRLLDRPLSPIYRVAYKLWKGYTGKSRIFPHRLGLIRTLKSAWRYITGLQR